MAQHRTEFSGSPNGTSGHEATGLNGTPISSPPQPIRREHYLSRFGSAATLMTVEWIPAGDGTLKRRVRFAPWPGL